MRYVVGSISVDLIGQRIPLFCEKSIGFAALRTLFRPTLSLFCKLAITDGPLMRRKIPKLGGRATHTIPPPALRIRAKTPFLESGSGQMRNSPPVWFLDCLAALQREGIRLDYI